MANMNTSEIESRESRIVREYDAARQRKAQLEGRKEAMMKRIRDEFGVDSVQELENRIDENRSKISELEDKLTGLMDKLESALGISR